MLQKDNIKKILIVRFSSIGDIVLTTPVIRCTKLQTNAEIHYLTKAQYHPLLEANPYIDKIITIEKNINEVLPFLRKEGYDILIDLHKSLRSFLLKIPLGVPSQSFDKINWQKWLMVNFKINRLPDVHIVDRYFQAVQKIGVENDGNGLDYFISKALTKSGLMILNKKMSSKDSKNLFLSDDRLAESEKYIAFAIGAKHKTKRLPKQKILEICKKIKTPIVLLGGKDMKQEGAIIASEAGAHVVSACGLLNLHESAAIIRDAYKVITHDTGMMHIAAAFQKEIISIWGNTIPEFGMYPYFKKGVEKNTVLEVKDLACRPCSKIGFKECPKGHFRCMEEMDLEWVDFG